jgi:hypothetical protein
MSTRIPFASRALAALCAVSLLAVPTSAGAKTVRAELRVLTPTQVLEPGSTYLVGAEKVKTDPGADCFGGGGSGASFEFADPTALSLLAAGARANKSLSPLSTTDEFGFGLGICGVGSVAAEPGSFWYLKRNHTELSVGADQESIANGDEVLVYLAPDSFPSPNPAELELIAPARATPGSQISVSVIEHSCATDQTTFEVTCASAPAAGVTVGGGEADAITGADGTATVTAGTGPRLKLAATRAADIPSKVLKLCVNEELGACPASFGERIFGRREGDRITGTKGADVIRAGGGRDRVDIRKGGLDRVDCGPGTDTVVVKGADDKIAPNCETTRGR